MSLTDHKRLEHGAALRSNLAPLVDLHAIIEQRIDKLSERADALRAALERREREKSEEGDALGALGAASEDAVRRARLIGVKLEASFLEATIEESAYRAALAAAFPRGAGSIGPSPALRVEALRRIAGALEAHAEADPGGALRTIAAEGAAAIEDANSAAKVEQQETREADAQLEEARAAFDVSYLATKEILSGLLREAGRLDELRDIAP